MIGQSSDPWFCNEIQVKHRQKIYDFPFYDWLEAAEVAIGRGKGMKETSDHYKNYTLFFKVENNFLRFDNCSLLTCSEKKFLVSKLLVMTYVLVAVEVITYS